MESPFQLADLVPRILSFIPDGATYKTATLVCQQWHDICAGELRWMIAAYSNHLLTLIKMFPNADWDWNLVTANPNFTLNMIMNGDKIQWIWECIIWNPNMPWEIIRENLHRFKSWDIYKHDSTFWKNKCQDPHTISWDQNNEIVWDVISKSPNITVDIIKDNPDAPWNWRELSSNRNMTWEFIKSHHDECPDKNWDWFLISLHPNITWDVIRNHPTLRWDWSSVSRNPNITWDLIQNHSNMPWDLAAVLANPNITMDIIKTRFSHIRDWRYLSYNPNITIDFIICHFNEIWNLQDALSHPKFTLEMIKVVPPNVEHWFRYISANPNLTWEFIATHINERWDWRTLSANKFNAAQS